MTKDSTDLIPLVIFSFLILLRGHTGAYCEAFLIFHSLVTLQLWCGLGPKAGELLPYAAVSPLPAAPVLPGRCMPLTVQQDGHPTAPHQTTGRS